MRGGWKEKVENVTKNLLKPFSHLLFLTTPPPSTEIGIMNSLGDFLIGCLSPPPLTEDPIVDDDCMKDCVGVSES